jgi:methionine biosynthesis protein MetW
MDDLDAAGIVIKWITSASRVLDIGCADGTFAAELKQRLACHVVGVEPNPDRAAAAAQRGIDVHRGYFTSDLASSLDPFDIVLFMDVLEHVPDPVELLTLARSALRPGGRVIVSVPNVAHWTVRGKLLFGRFDYRPTGIMDATHLRWFTAKTIASVVSSAGFTIQQQDVSRGTWLPVYRERAPWKWLSPNLRRALLNRLCRWRPGLFGCQHVLCAAKD